MTPNASATHRRWRRAAAPPLIAMSMSLWLALPSHGHAQDRFSAERLAPAPATPENLISVWGARPLDPGDLTLTLDGSYSRRPLSVNDADGDRVADLIGSISTLELIAGVGLFERVDLALTLRGHRTSRGTELSDSAPPSLSAAVLDESQAAFGDLGITPRIKLFGPDRADQTGFGMALVVPVWLPTGDDDAYAGEGVRVEPRVALQASLGGVRLALNVGYLVRPNAELLGAELDDMLSYGGGAAIDIAGPVSVVAEVNGHLNVLADDIGTDDAPTELLAALRLGGDRWLAQLGGGIGLVGGIDEPVFRILGAVSLLPAPPEPPRDDRDYDGLIDPTDRCPQEPEDTDQFEDEDGCPDPDNDGDGILDKDDRCPLEAEDKDGFEDEDGCLDADNDKDGIADAQDACPNEVGVDNADESKRGCPSDRDGDSVLDTLDACPDKPGVPSTDEKRNGCPPDSDGDGQLDEHDACPQVPGEANVDPTKNGCPRARVEQGQIVITERVEFKTNSAKLLPSSNGILNEVLTILQNHTEIKKLSIEGHTDSTGKRKYNQRLSEKRAQSVMKWLTDHGVDRLRLTYRGYGPDKPLDPSDTPEARDRNRRVEFVILEQEGAPPTP